MNLAESRAKGPPGTCSRTVRRTIMVWFSRTFRLNGLKAILPVWILAILLMFPGPQAEGQKADPDVLRIGSLATPDAGTPKEKAALESLQSFIKDETGMNNEIVHQKDWREVADKMAKGDLHLGVFQGYEFAWAQENHPGLKPLALAVNVSRYPIAYVVTGKASQAKDFAGLQGQSIALATGSPAYLRLYLDRQAEASGKKSSAFFSRSSPRTTSRTLSMTPSMGWCKRQWWIGQHWKRSRGASRAGSAS